MTNKQPKRTPTVVAGYLLLCILCFAGHTTEAGVMGDYCVVPPFVAQSVPPLVMFDVERDHKLFYQAYNDASDIDDDGQIENTYKHSVVYYGYFDPFKCYTHSGGSSSNDKFTPVSISTDKFCNSGQWSGNVLNWLTMSRIDVLRKVLYGGYRDQDSNTYTELERSFIPQDAHSWGKELTGRLCYNSSISDPNKRYTISCIDDSDCDSSSSCVDKSLNLIGIAAADAPSECSSPVTVNWDTSNNTNKTDANTIGNILIVKYSHSGNQCGDITQTLVPPPAECPNCPYETVVTDTIYSSYQVSPSNFLGYYYISDFNYNSSNKKDALPSKDHDQDNFNFFAVSEFNVSNSAKGDWQFLVDSDDGSELLIDGKIVASYGGCHSACFSGTPPATVDSSTTCAGGSAAPLPGTVNLTSGWHRLIVRHSDNSGQDGIKVWYKIGNAANWTIFGNSLSLRAPIITNTNKCSIQSQYFIDTGTPVSGTAKRHLFCNTSISSGGMPLLRMLTNKTNRIWEWSSKERPVCDNSLGTPADKTVRVEVCNSSVGIGTENCKNYNGTYKPVGLLQKYGEGSGDKICSRKFTKSCSTDSDCGTGEGLCIYKAPMYFGLMTGSYTDNLSGGVLRKNIGSVLDEVNTNNGILQTSENVPGNIIHTLDRLKIIDYDYGSYSYQNCGWIEDRPMNQGECKNWGNPLAEIMYENLRYFAGKGAPTAAFTYSGSQDAGLNLSKPDWGYTRGSTTYQPYDIYPACAKPFMLLLSDVNPNFDSDQVPGSAFNSYSEDSALPHLNMNVSTLANTIGNYEGINGNNWFVGETTSLNDFVCTSKSVSNLSMLRGLCPMEPTKKGTYYTAAVAYYGKTLFNANTGRPNVNTFAVALAPPFPDLKIKAGSSYITFVPQGKSASGCLGVTEACHDKCTFTIDNSSTGKGLSISNCSSNAFCPTNQLVNVYVERIEYDSSGNIIYANFRINFEDSEQGADHDMDAIVHYEVCTPSSYNLQGTSCNTSLTSNQIEIKLSSDYAAGCIDQALGFTVSGTTADGSYLPVKDADIGSGSSINSLPLTWSRVFTASSTGSTAGFLKDPLWYAAKWGGFIDANGNNIPDQTREWAKNDGVTPDNYYLVVNPLKLEQQLDKALNDILNRVSSGTAASILNNSQGSGASLLQAVFYPQKDFESNTSASWVGEMQNLWYYIDPFFNNSTIREDTVADRTLNLVDDYTANFFFDTTSNQTMVDRKQDTDGKGTYVDKGNIAPDFVNSLWKAGEILQSTANSSRTIKTVIPVSGTDTMIDFTVANATTNTGTKATLQSYLQVSDDTEATSIVDYVRGTDYPRSGYSTDPVYRGRTVTYQGTTGVWKLGDIVSSTPKIEGNVGINSYGYTPPGGYKDLAYNSFLDSFEYGTRGTAYVGANDGMLHAFKLGILDVRLSDSQGNSKARLIGNNLGSEQWAFIPKNALPYLRYLSCVSGGNDSTYCNNKDYGHIYYVDNTPLLVDASIHKVSTDTATGVAPTCTSSNPWDCPKQTVFLKDGLGNAILGDTGIPVDPAKSPTDPSLTHPSSFIQKPKLDLDNTSWRTILIGSMGLGGASRNNSGTETCTTGTSSATCVKTPITSVGYSSYFALDVTNPSSPSFMWEFSGNPAAGDYLGYATSGPAIVRVGNKYGNGKWFAVFASGPMGPIDTTAKEFKGTSHQDLKLFVVDLASGALARTINTGVSNAFAASLSSSVIDADRGNFSSSGNYQDDALYLGYTQLDSSAGTWTKGGVLRLLTRESTNPADWTIGTLINNTGPVTTSVSKLQDRKNKTLWIYFGTGRYFYKSDDTDNQRVLYGVKDPCYSTTTGSPLYLPLGPVNGFDTSCTATVSSSNLTDQTASSSAPAAKLTSGSAGWLINLDCTGTSCGGTPLTDGFASERVITDPIAATTGTVFFTTFRPTADICGFGGNSYLWAVKYDTGATPVAMEGKALLQLSTGSFAEINLHSAFGAKYGRRTTDPFTGVPPRDRGLALMVPPKPEKKILHIQEK